MKQLTAFVVALCLAAPAMADGTSNLSCCGWNYYEFRSSLVIDGHPAGCDTNDRTPPQVLQCKIDYWTQEIKDRQEKADKAAKHLETAKDQLRAFQAVPAR